jgi:hypothetical protein
MIDMSDVAKITSSHKCRLALHTRAAQHTLSIVDQRGSCAAWMMPLSVPFSSDHEP